MRALQECMETYIFLLNQRGAPEFNNCICNPYWAPERKHVHNSTYAYRILSKLYTDLQHKIPNPFLLQKVQYIYIYKPNNPSINHMVADTPTDPNIPNLSRPQDQYGHAPAQPSPPRLRVLAMPSVARGSIVPGVWLRSARLVGRRELSWLLIDVNWWLRIRDF